MRAIRLWFLSLIPALALFAQADRGSVVGAISDATGGFVANVSLQPVGAYMLTAQAKGFQSQEIKGIDVQVKVRNEISNPLDSVVFGAPVTDFSAKNFGVVTSQGNSPRRIQSGLKLIW